MVRAHNSSYLSDMYFYFSQQNKRAVLLLLLVTFMWLWQTLIVLDCTQGLIITKCCTDTVTSWCSISVSSAFIKTGQFYCYDNWLISKCQSIVYQMEKLILEMEMSILIEISSTKISKIKIIIWNLKASIII